MKEIVIKAYCSKGSMENVKDIDSLYDNSFDVKSTLFPVPITIKITEGHESECVWTVRETPALPLFDIPCMSWKGMIESVDGYKFCPYCGKPIRIEEEGK